jgi:hypothetical protein
MTNPRLAVPQRTYERAGRGHALKDWGRRPQPYDPDSSLALDDDGFMVELGGLVNVTALSVLGTPVKVGIHPVSNHLQKGRLA